MPEPGAESNRFAASRSSGALVYAIEWCIGMVYAIEWCMGIGICEPYKAKVVASAVLGKLELNIKSQKLWSIGSIECNYAAFSFLHFT